MAFLEIGYMGLAPEKERERFAKDLRKAFDLTQAYGVNVDAAFSQAGAGLIQIVRKIGYRKAMHLLCVMNCVAQRNTAYIRKIESDKSERDKLIAQLRDNFADVRARQSHSMVGGVFLPLIALAAVAAAVVSKKSSLPPPPPPGPPPPTAAQIQRENDKRTILAYVSLYDKWHANKKLTILPSMQLRDEAVAAAMRLGLPKTADGIASESGVPKTELWPDTLVPVETYLMNFLKKPVQRIPGTTVKGTNVKNIDLDLGREEDLAGIYSVGVDDIMGPELVGRQSRPRRVSAPRIERIQMEPLEIRAGRPQAPSQMDPETAAVLSMLRATMPSERHRRATWPANGGYALYKTY